MKKHPTLPYQLDELGNVYDLDGNGITPKLYSEDGYYCVSKYHVHVLMAETYLGLLEAPGKIVNHKNGVKSDLRLDNLELTTYSGNLEHAYETGLRNDNQPVIVKNLSTGVINLFLSIGACAKKFEVNNFVIASALSPENYGKVWRDHYVIAREQDGVPSDIRFDDNGKAKPVVVVCKDGHVKVFAKALDAATFLGVKVVNLRARLHSSRNRLNKSLRYGEMEVTYKETYTGNLQNAEFVEASPHVYIPTVRKPVPVKVQFADGTVESYSGIRDFCEKKGYSHAAVAKSVWKNGRYKDMMITYHRPPQSKG